MTKYNIYCKDQSNLENIYSALVNLSYGIDDIKYTSSDFMPQCVTLTTEMYTDEGLFKLLNENNILKGSFIILRHLHKRQVL